VGWCGGNPAGEVTSRCYFRVTRGSGANPRLQQSTVHPDTAALRFHLERVTDGVYRLRNSNPDGGGDCAYHEAGTTAVGLAPCAGSLAHEWTLFTGAASWGRFQLRNRAAGKCIDTNGQGWATGDIVLKSCVVSASTQELFHDAFSWPPN
jgi:hypothetical protein